MKVFSVLKSITKKAIPQGFDNISVLVERLRRPQHNFTHMEAQQPHAVHENGDAVPKVAIKGADGGAVQSGIAAKTHPSEAPMEASFKKPSEYATTEVHSTTGPAIPAGDVEARSQEEAKQKSQEPWAKGMTDTAMHTPMQVIPPSSAPLSVQGTIAAHPCSSISTISISAEITVGKLQRHSFCQGKH